MIASLYISSETFKYNGIDSDLIVLKKLVELNDLIKKLRNSLDNIFHVNKNTLLTARILQDGSTINDIICHKRKINNDVLNIFLQLFQTCKQVDLSFNDLIEYLSLEDEDNCTALVVFNWITGLPQNHQILSNIKGWLEFRRYYLGKFPKTPDYFITESSKYFERIIIHPDNTRGLRKLIKSHSRKLVNSLAVLNDHLVDDLRQSLVGYPEFLNDFAITRRIDGASLEGRKHDKFKFIFYEGTTDELTKYCESHLKIFRDDSGARKHCRIYFAKPNMTQDNPFVYIGSICEHL